MDTCIVGSTRFGGSCTLLIQLERCICQRSLQLAFFCIVMALFFCSSLQAAQVTLAWEPSNSASDGYRLYQRTEGGRYDYASPVWPSSGDDPTQTTCTIGNLDDNTTYYFVVRAYMGSDESADSNEIQYETGPSIVTDLPSVDTYTIAATAGTNGSIPQGTVTVDAGGSQAFAIISAENHHVADVLVDGQSVGARTSYTFTDVSRDHSISASFTPDSPPEPETDTNAANSSAEDALLPTGAESVNEDDNSSNTQSGSSDSGDSSSGSDDSTPEDSSGYTFCAEENGTCRFSGTRQVAYGAEGQFNYKIANGRIACNNATFGDPIYGVVKACYYSEKQPKSSLSGGGGKFKKSLSGGGGELVLQENEAGFCSVDGTIGSNFTGFTGNGFANTTNAAGNRIIWRINVQYSDTYTLEWRYANGGSTNCDATVYIGNEQADVTFPVTGSWTSWTDDVVDIYLNTGENIITLMANTASGLPNIDALSIADSGLSGVECAEGGSEGYTFCANENETCSFSGTREVAYGAEGHFNYQTATGRIACNNATFGDPIYGVVKSCYYSDLQPGGAGSGGGR